MGNKNKNQKKGWTTHEAATVLANWTSGKPLPSWSVLLPERTQKAIETYARQVLRLRPLLEYRTMCSPGTWAEISLVLARGDPMTAAAIAGRIHHSAKHVRVLLRQHAGIDCHVAFTTYAPKGGGAQHWWSAGSSKASHAAALQSSNAAHDVNASQSLRPDDTADSSLDATRDRS